MISQDVNKYNLPDSPGVYFFKKGKDILYVGKATSLKDRVKSYFSQDLLLARGAKLIKMREVANFLSFETTDSVLEALILEAHYIKKHLPPYNSAEKDDKSYNYVVITEEEFPQIYTMRGRELKQKERELKIKNYFGPFPHGGQLREALKIVRKIFPYRDQKCIPYTEQQKRRNFSGTPRPCFNRQIGLCPGVCTGEITKKGYAKTIRNITLFFEGKKKQLAKTLEKEMKGCARERNFEKANIIKNQIFALNHIRDVALIKKDLIKEDYIRYVEEHHENANFEYRIEAYDIAHTSGNETVGVMVVLEDGAFNKNEYRKFKIRGKGNVTIDDTKNLEEVLVRRLGHDEWMLPNLVVIDGGIAQMNVAKKVFEKKGFNIEIVSVVKDEHHKAHKILGKKGIIEKHNQEILLTNSEAHRFVIAFHRKRRGEGFLTK